MGLTQIFLLAAVLSSALASSRVKRVVGGKPYERGDYTYSVSLWYMGANNRFTQYTYNRHHSCGGSLIAADWVLTSAACFDDYVLEGTGNLTLWRVVLGQFDQYDEEAEKEAQFLEAEEIFYLPEYDYQRSHGDLALLKLSAPANLTNPMISTVNINEDTSCPVAGQECTIIGWGQLDDQYYGYGAFIPRAAKVNVQSLDDCKATYEQIWLRRFMGNILINEENICAGVFPEGGKDACYGDTGGPLLCACGENGELEVAATASTGFGCARRGFAGVYTNVAAFADWIKETMANN